MKYQAIIVLVAILLSVAIPPSLTLTCGYEGHTIIGALDICHAATPALSSSGNLPCVQERTCHPLPLPLQETVENENLFFKSLLTSFQDERPPKA
jgi:hypothetical protein